jgi:alpha-amylase
MGYAYILTHPGTPCVMWDHYFDWGEDLSNKIKTLMEARQSCGVHSRSKLKIVAATDGLYAATIDDKMAVKLGHDHWSPAGDDWTHVCGDHDWSVWRR